MIPFNSCASLILSSFFHLFFQGCKAVAGVIDLGTVEIFPIFRAMQKGLIDQDTGLVLLESQIIMSGLIAPETNEKLSLEEGLARNLINPQMFQQLQELQDTLSLISRLTESRGPLSVVEAIEKKIINERVGLKILEAHLATGGFILPSNENCINLEEAKLVWKEANWRRQVEF